MKSYKTMSREELIAELEIQKQASTEYEKYRILFDSSPEAIFFQTLDGKILDCNRSACKLYGYSSAKLLELSSWNLMTDNCAEKLPENLMKEHKNKGIILKETHKKKNGVEFPVEVLTKLITIDNDVFRWALIHDLTHLQGPYSEIAIKDKKAKDMFEHLPEIFGEPEIILDANEKGYVISTNKSFYEKTGYTKRDITKGLHLTELVKPQIREEAQQRIEQIIMTGSSDIDEITVLKKDGSTISLLVYASHIDLQNKRKGVRIFAIDITDHKYIEKELVNKEKFHTLGEMTGGVIHDINNILTIIHGYVEILLRKPPKNLADMSYKDIIKKIKRASSDGQSILKRVQNYYRDGISKREDQAFEPVNMNDIVEDVLDMLRPNLEFDAHKKRRKIFIEKKFGKIHSVYGNPPELREVVNNIVKNSFEAMPSGGTISFITCCKYSSVILRITDTGCGMSETVKSEIFSPFFSTKGENGTGIGMAVSHDIIKKHGGSIEVESEEGSGTTFEITLPVEKREKRVKSRETSSKTDTEQKKILVIDDEISICDLLYQYLTYEGFFVSKTQSWKKAKDLFKQHSYDILLVDYNMPEISGVEIARWIRKKPFDITIIMITGDDISLEKLNEKGKLFDKVILKPIDLQMLTGYIKSCL